MFQEDDYPFTQKVALVVCPSCKFPLVGTSEELRVGQEEFIWENSDQSLAAA